MCKEIKMENLIIKATKYTPEINLDASTNILSIVGKSYPENTFEFYKPVMIWVEKFLEIKYEKEIVFNIELEYLNSSSLKAYFDLFDCIELAHEKGQNLAINWIYDEDNDIAEETGEDFIADFESLSIKLIVKN